MFNPVQGLPKNHKIRTRNPKDQYSSRAPVHSQCLPTLANAPNCPINQLPCLPVSASSSLGPCPNALAHSLTHSPALAAAPSLTSSLARARFLPEMRSRGPMPIRPIHPSVPYLPRLAPLKPPLVFPVFPPAGAHQTPDQTKRASKVHSLSEEESVCTAVSNWSKRNDCVSGFSVEIHQKADDFSSQ